MTKDELYAVERIRQYRVKGKFYREIALLLRDNAVPLSGRIKEWTLNSVYDFAALHEIDVPGPEVGPNRLLVEIEMVLNMSVSDSRKLSLITKILP